MSGRGGRKVKHSNGDGERVVFHRSRVGDWGAEFFRITAVECVFEMAASNSLSNGRAVHRRNGFGAGGASQNHKAMSLFQCQPEYHQDCARLYSNDNCGDVKQFRGNFMNSKDASRRKRRGKGRPESSNKMIYHIIEIACTIPRQRMESAWRKKGRVHQDIPEAKA